MAASPRVTVLKGTLEYLVLKTLSAGEPLHGFEILEWVGEATDEALLLEEGALYPTLHRMEKRGGSKGSGGSRGREGERGTTA